MSPLAANISYLYWSTPDFMQRAICSTIFLFDHSAVFSIHDYAVDIHVRTCVAVQSDMYIPTINVM